MAVNPTSLENLSPGNRKGTRNKITKEYALKMTEYLMNDFDTFIGELAVLSPKERTVAKLKLMDIFMPKKQEIEVESIETPKWEIVRAKDRPKELPAEDVAHEVVEQTPVNLLPVRDETERTAELLAAQWAKPQQSVAASVTPAAEETIVPLINRRKPQA